MATRTQKTLTLVATSALSRIAEYILANPQEFNQEQFIQDAGMSSEAGCIAYIHTKINSGPRALKNRTAKHNGEWSKKARTLLFSTFSATRQHILDSPFLKGAQRELGLSDEQAYLLMGGSRQWPERFSDKYNSAASAKGRARAAHDFILFFIKTNGTGKTERELRAAAKAASAAVNEVPR